MAIENHPKYQEWRNALDYLKEAHERYGEALIKKSPYAPAAKKDLEKAQLVYNEVCAGLE